MTHEEFLERLTKALKLACQTIINNADKLAAKVDDNLGVESLDIIITMPSMSDDSLVRLGIEVNTKYFPKDAAMMLAGFEEGEF